LICKLVMCGVVAGGAHAGTLPAMVDGYCDLNDTDVLCGTKVEIDHSVIHPAKYTDASGHFGPWGGVLPGWHTFTYTRLGYETKEVDYKVPWLGCTLPKVTLKTKAQCDASEWKDLPYELPGTTIMFPYDEGEHKPTSTYRVEWWYMNMRLTTADGESYGAFAAFFKPPALVSPCMVLMSIIDLKQGKLYSDAKLPALWDAHDEWLDLQAGILPGDRWSNTLCEGALIPYKYELSVSGNDGGSIWLDLDMQSMKRPMPVGGDGRVEFTDGIWSYYYSQPRVEVAGKMHVPSFPLLGKEVTGHGWIDHQWANFPSKKVTWEWMSINLDDMRDIMVANVWVGGEAAGSFSGGLNYYDADCALEVLEGYTMTPIATWTDWETGKEFATGWSVTEPTKEIDLVVSALFDHQIMRIGENEILPLCFWEGACDVKGTIGGKWVTGTAYAEVTHAYEPPPCDADITGDGVVDVLDLLEVLGGWGLCPPIYPPYCPADITGDGVVDVLDLLEVLSGWGVCG